MTKKGTLGIISKRNGSVPGDWIDLCGSGIFIYLILCLCLAVRDGAGNGCSLTAGSSMYKNGINGKVQNSHRENFHREFCIFYLWVGFLYCGFSI